MSGRVRVRIEAGGAEVEIEAEESLRAVQATARRLHRDAIKGGERLGPASAHQHAERRGGRFGFAWGLGETERPEVTG